MKFRLSLFAFLITAFAYCQNLEGRWVNSGFLGEENLAYDFIKGQEIKMYYAGDQIPTNKPVKYELKKDGDSFVIEMHYVNSINGYNANVVGLIRFLDEDRIEMEFWDKAKLPEDMNFTEESLIYQRQ